MEKKYEQFKLKWMLEHGHTLKELIDELEELREESDPDETLQDIFDEWEFGYGFGSEIWPCYEEYLDCEGAAEEKGFLEQEFDYIVGFAVESCFDNELACQQFRSLCNTQGCNIFREGHLIVFLENPGKIIFAESGKCRCFFQGDLFCAVLIYIVGNRIKLLIFGFLTGSFPVRKLIFYT